MNPMLTTNIFPSEFPPYQLTVNPRDLSSYQEQVIFYQDTQKKSCIQSLKDLAQVIHNFETLSDEYEWDTTFWLALADKLFQGNKFEATLAVLDSVQKLLIDVRMDNALETHGVDLILMYACTYWAMGERSQAAYYFRELMDQLRETGEEHPYHYVMASQITIGDTDDPAEILHTGLERFPDSEQILLGLAKYRFLHNDLEAARTHFFTVYKSCVCNIQATAGLAITALLDGLNYTEFKQYADKTLQITPQTKGDIYLAGEIHYLCQNYEEASSFYQAAPIGPWYADIWDQGDIYTYFGI